MKKILLLSAGLFLSLGEAYGAKRPSEPADSDSEDHREIKRRIMESPESSSVTRTPQSSASSVIHLENQEDEFEGLMGIAELAENSHVSWKRSQCPTEFPKEVVRLYNDRSNLEVYDNYKLQLFGAAAHALGKPELYQQAKELAVCPVPKKVTARLIPLVMGELEKNPNHNIPEDKLAEMIIFRNNQLKHQKKYTCPWDFSLDDRQTLEDDDRLKSLKPDLRYKLEVKFMGTLLNKLNLSHIYEDVAQIKIKDFIPGSDGKGTIGPKPSWMKVALLNELEENIEFQTAYKNSSAEDQWLYHAIKNKYPKILNKGLVLGKNLPQDKNMNEKSSVEKSVEYSEKTGSSLRRVETPVQAISQPSSSTAPIHISVSGGASAGLVSLRSTKGKERMPSEESSESSEDIHPFVESDEPSVEIVTSTSAKTPVQVIEEPKATAPSFQTNPLDIIYKGALNLLKSEEYESGLAILKNLAKEGYSMAQNFFK